MIFIVTNDSIILVQVLGFTYWQARSSDPEFITHQIFKMSSIASYYESALRYKGSNFSNISSDWPTVIHYATKMTSNKSDFVGENVLSEPAFFFSF